jgi:sulfonate transport system substrate-binding protein
VVVTERPATIIATSAESGIKDLKDLKGEKVGINSGTAQQAVVFRNLRAAGLKPDDIKPINLGLAEFADALRSRQIDAAVLKQPDRARYLKSVVGTGATEIESTGDGNMNLKILYASKTALADPAQAAAIRDLVDLLQAAGNFQGKDAEGRRRIRPSFDGLNDKSKTSRALHTDG